MAMTALSRARRHRQSGKRTLAFARLAELVAPYQPAKTMILRSCHTARSVNAGIAPNSGRYSALTEEGHMKRINGLAGLVRSQESAAGDGELSLS